MGSKVALIILLVAGFAWPALAQQDDTETEQPGTNEIEAEEPVFEDIESPAPPPRPSEFMPDGSGDVLTPDTEIEGSAFDLDPTGRPDYSHITTPQPLTLSARLTADGPIISEGLVWRLFEPRVDETGELAMIAKSEDATANFSVPPGEYVLHAAFGRAQTIETIFVEPGPNTLTMAFDVGALQLRALVVGDIPIPANLLRFDIYSNGPSGRMTVAEDVAPDELIHLNAGIYSIESHFGDLNAVIRSELRVESGQITEATLYHRASQISLKLVSEEGGEAIADVEWTVQSLGGETLFTDIGAFPATVLAEGEYVVLAKLGDNVYNREFEVRPGGQREIEILTSVYQ